MTIHGSLYRTSIAQKLSKLMKGLKRLKPMKKRKNKTESKEKAIQEPILLKNLLRRNLKRFVNTLK